MPPPFPASAVRVRLWIRVCRSYNSHWCVMHSWPRCSWCRTSPPPLWAHPGWKRPGQSSPGGSTSLLRHEREIFPGTVWKLLRHVSLSSWWGEKQSCGVVPLMFISNLLFIYSHRKLLCSHFCNFVNCAAAWRTGGQSWLNKGIIVWKRWECMCVCMLQRKPK